MGYQEEPWIFTGKALYQLQLVKSEVAKKYIPSNFKLVEFLGYTLGGFYLARYTDSPVGNFDELVVLSGLVWNPPTSCAWAARVYVNNKEARNHGLKHVGLPSRLARFTTNGDISSSTNNHTWWCDGDPVKKEGKGLINSVSVKNIEPRRYFTKRRDVKNNICTFVLSQNSNLKWKGPRLNLTLPSFSGNTPDYPDLIKYNCKLETNVLPLKPLKLSFVDDTNEENDELMDEILKGMPICTLSFNNMNMTVKAPRPISIKNQKKIKNVSMPLLI